MTHKKNLFIAGMLVLSTATTTLSFNTAFAGGPADIKAEAVKPEDIKASLDKVDVALKAGKKDEAAKASVELAIMIGQAHGADLSGISLNKIQDLATKQLTAPRFDKAGNLTAEVDQLDVATLINTATAQLVDVANGQITGADAVAAISRSTNFLVLLDGVARSRLMTTKLESTDPAKMSDADKSEMALRQALLKHVQQMSKVKDPKFKAANNQYATIESKINALLAANPQMDVLDAYKQVAGDKIDLMRKCQDG